jgi:cell wall-associated NlpC family hydrolase
MWPKQTYSTIYTLLWIGLVCCCLLSNCRSKKKRAAKKASKQTVKVANQKTKTPEAKRFLSTDEIKSVISAALGYTGTPYRYGGASRAGMDCSGLIMASYASIKKSIPRPSNLQATCGEDVSLKQAQPGDLIIFHDPPGVVNHVGMVTERLPDGTLRFIHSSSSLGVSQAKLSDPYWTKRFAKVHRPLVAE